MWTIKKKVIYVLYEIFAAKLPVSRHLKIAKKLRYFFAKQIVAEIGKNVNIEKNARFTPQLRIGDRSGIGVNCIGKGSIIGAGAVVTKNVEPYSVMGGVLAKLIKKGNPQINKYFLL